MAVDDGHRNIVRGVEGRMLEAGTNNIVIPVEEFYELAERSRLTAKFYDGVIEAGAEKHLLFAFGDKVVAVTRDVAP